MVQVRDPRVFWPERLILKNNKVAGSGMAAIARDHLAAWVLWESFMEVFLDVFEAVFDSQCGTFPIGKLAGCLLNILMIHHEFPDKYHPKVSGGFSMATC